MNSQKSDKLPTPQRLMYAKDWITHWWRQGWSNNENEFFVQANFALPNLNVDNRNYDDVFDALGLQRDRIKDFQQLPDWN